MAITLRGTGLVVVLFVAVGTIFASMTSHGHTTGRPDRKLESSLADRYRNRLGLNGGQSGGGGIDDDMAAVGTAGGASPVFHADPLDRPDVAGSGLGKAVIAKPRVVPIPVPDYLVGTAIVTMAAGDESGRLAVGLVQSLRDSGTQVPEIVVMLARGGKGSADCQNSTWKALMGRGNRLCQAPDAIEGEVVSQQYVDTLRRLGATILMIDTVPETVWTSKIAGGRQVRSTPAARLPAAGLTPTTYTLRHGIII